MSSRRQAFHRLNSRLSASSCTSLLVGEGMSDATTAHQAMDPMQTGSRNQRAACTAP